MSSYAHKVNDPTATIASLQEQIATLQSLVENTFKKPMAECLAELEGTDASARAADAQAALQGRLTGAKLLVSAAYVYLDVIWMYLKSKGIDPKTHPVHDELAYFAKLKKAAGSEEGPSQRIDQGAAARMIAAAAGEKRKHKRFDGEEEDEKSEPTKPTSQKASKKESKAKDAAKAEPKATPEKDSAKSKGDAKTKTKKADKHEPKKRADAPKKKRAHA